ncbi:MAG: TetR family transcriptional regulator [Novosphingobium sp. 17-62-19]|uniref:TetR/AcrR family transcriptional regulator n=1 Tax=Novosphingobium sp. 17-62-19 TaxID=1970406 RepID=UPI000BC72D61|nr:TetR/AcrR family transcriptional regulator [Novosphingobium sp. 17-62-19]OYX95092.1 MAG: TetR family transcriptional regulator [Novosphingobium sp. 35-62-5]OZA21632.1 MAG: TetR family transcriptional regulator [Novosphingobium sp. 17-62-19]HQS96879.1 TetR/AcrR family transcriptional regulator [Novosphingobium sp.]
MADTGKGTKRFGEKRQAIVHAASVLVNEVGVQATTLSEVARAIGLNATSITYYFSRKDQLIVAVYEETLDRMDRMASEALAEPDPEARLRKYVALHVALRTRIRKGERGLVTALSEIRSLDPESQQPLLDRYRHVVEKVRSFFGEPTSAEQRALYSARAHVLLEAMMWWPVWSLRYSTLDFPRVEQRMVDILAHGLPALRGTWKPLRLEVRHWRSDSEGAPSQNDEFLRAATIMINQLGYRGASVNRIAESINVTKGSFYHHHEAKDELVLACFDKSHDRLSATQMAGKHGGGDYWERLSSVLYELLRLQFFDPMPLLRTTALQALNSEHKNDVVTRSNRLARRFAGFLIDGIADGSVRPIDPLVASQIIMSTLNAAYEARRWAERFGDGDEAIATYASTLFSGLIDPA